MKSAGAEAAATTISHFAARAVLPSVAATDVSGKSSQAKQAHVHLAHEHITDERAGQENEPRGGPGSSAPRPPREPTAAPA